MTPGVNTLPRIEVFQTNNGAVGGEADCTARTTWRRQIGDVFAFTIHFALLIAPTLDRVAATSVVNAAGAWLPQAART